MTFWIKFAQKGHWHFWSKTERVKRTIEFCIFQLVLKRRFTLNKQFWILEPNLPKKDISSRKQKQLSITIEFCMFELVYNQWQKVRKPSKNGQDQNPWYLHLGKFCCCQKLVRGGENGSYPVFPRMNMTHAAVDRNVRKQVRDIIFDAIKSFRKKSKRPDTISIIEYITRNPTNFELA